MKRLKRSDDGAILVLALLVITTVALVSVALLTKGQGNLRTTVQLRSVAGSAYAADTAAQMAINSLELGNDPKNMISPTATSLLDSGWVYNDSGDGAGCFGKNADGTARSTLSLSNLYPKSGTYSADTSATVVCTKVAGSGVLGSGGGVGIDNAGNARALTILGTGAGNQLTLSSKSDDLLVRGGIASNANLTVNNGLFSNSYVWATSCSGLPGIKLRVKSTPALDCAHAYDPNLDPNLGDPLPSGATMPALRTKAGAVQHPSGDVCVFDPGYYDDAEALSNATDNCDGTPSVFRPGLYYFDFHNDSDDIMSNDELMGGSSVWTIKNTVIGGTLAGGSIPGRCVSPIVSKQANAGVQFVFGGTSRMALSKQGGGDPAVELCATYNGGVPPVAIYGKKDGDTASPITQVSKPTTVQTTGSTPVFDAGTDTPAQLAAEDGAAAKWAASTTTNSTVNLTLGGYTAAGIPEGSILQSAVVKIRHRTTGTGAVTYNVNVTASGGPATNDTFAKVAAYATKSVDVTDSLQGLAHAIHDGTSTAGLGPSIKISQNNLKNVALEVDAVTLEVTYIKPVPRGQNDAAVTSSDNCLRTTCNFLQTSNGNTKSSFVVQGVTYLPNGAINMGLSNASGDVVAFRYGLVARSLLVSGWPQYVFADPLVSIPDEGPGLGTNVTAVDLEVYVCPGAASCSATPSKLTLKTRVLITDPTTQDPAPNTRKINILSWSEQR